MAIELVRSDQLEAMPTVEAIGVAQLQGLEFDTATGLEIMGLLQDMTRTGERAAFVVTHDTRLEKFATRVDHITDGILTVGKPVAPTPQPAPEPALTQQ